MLELDPENVTSHVEGLADLVLQLDHNATMDKEAAQVSKAAQRATGSFFLLNLAVVVKTSWVFCFSVFVVLPFLCVRSGPKYRFFDLKCGGQD